MGVYRRAFKNAVRARLRYPTARRPSQQHRVQHPLFPSAILARELKKLKGEALIKYKKLVAKPRRTVEMYESNKVKDMEQYLQVRCIPTPY